MRDYELHAKRQMEAAAAAHKTWWAKLPPEKRKLVTHLGLNTASEDDLEVNSHNPCNVSDIADSPRASTEWDPSNLDLPEEVLAEELDVTLDKARQILSWSENAVAAALERHEGDLLAIVVGGLIAAKNVKIATAGLAFATKLAGLNGYKCQADFARQHSVSRSAISKSTKGWQKDLNLRPSVHQKSTAACKTYAHIGKLKHWRKQKVNATALLKKLKSTPPPEQT